ncbi:hypothetical protein chiPu_0027496, partial [Chiloscyllium punctatum]|nr:hypothetical protein [Chiloscyllium punctatum]
MAVAHARSRDLAQAFHGSLEKGGEGACARTRPGIGVGGAAHAPGDRNLNVTRASGGGMEFAEKHLRERGWRRGNPGG